MSDERISRIDTHGTARITRHGTVLAASSLLLEAMPELGFFGQAWIFSELGLDLQRGVARRRPRQQHRGARAFPPLWSVTFDWSVLSSLQHTRRVEDLVSDVDRGAGWRTSRQACCQHDTGPGPPRGRARGRPATPAFACRQVGLRIRCIVKKFPVGKLRCGRKLNHALTRF